MNPAPPGTVDLQAVLSSSSGLAAGDGPDPGPHHPVTCDGNLRYEGDGTLACDHASVPPEDMRTLYCLHYSVSLLLIELSQHL